MEQLDIFSILEPNIDTRGFKEKHFIRLRDHKEFELNLFKNTHRKEEFTLRGDSFGSDREGFSCGGDYAQMMLKVESQFTPKEDFKHFCKTHQEWIQQHKQAYEDKFGFQPLNFYRKAYQTNRLLFLQQDIHSILNANLVLENEKYTLYVGDYKTEPNKDKNPMCQIWYLVYRCEPHYNILVIYHGVYDDKWMSSANVYYGYKGTMIEDVNQDKLVYSAKWYAHLFNKDMTLKQLIKILGR